LPGPEERAALECAARQTVLSPLPGFLNPGKMRSLSQHFAGVRQECNMAGAFNRPSHFALVFGADAGLATRANLSLVRHIAAQHIDLFVIDFGILISAEGAFAWAREKTTASSLIIISHWLIAHLQNSLLVFIQPANLT